MSQIFQFILSSPWLVALGTVFGIIIVVAIHDISQKKSTIIHNFPVIGHFRYWLEAIGPELRQYWVANDKEERPFNRSERAWIYSSAKGQNNSFGFGTTENIYDTGYPIIKHATFPFPDHKSKGFSEDKSALPCIKVLGATHGRKKAFRPSSIINVSAMSFGSLGERAVTAINKAVARAGCLQNTGEGGLSPYHRSGGDLIYQLGTGYFGSRDEQGFFNMARLKALIEQVPSVRAIEIKLSQGAKPGKGGILPGRKVTASIAAIRGVKIGEDCISPNAHSAFSTVDELIDFVEKIADETGLPVGIKSAIGELNFWQHLAERMDKRRAGPDFITIDGAEGGTGAAPLTFADHVALPFKVGFGRVYQIFLAQGISEEIVWIGSGKLGFPDRAIVAMAMGCDMINIAREAMIAIGCIQALKCHTDHCPAGVATQNPWLQRGLNIDNKAMRLEKFIKSFRKELISLSHAAGYQHPSQFTGQDIEFCSGINKFSTLDTVIGYSKLSVDPLLSSLETAAPAGAKLHLAP
jgi:glutamate synthase domain-containing protein 2